MFVVLFTLNLQKLQYQNFRLSVSKTSFSKTLAKTNYWLCKLVLEEETARGTFRSGARAESGFNAGWLTWNFLLVSALGDQKWGSANSSNLLATESTDGGRIG